MERQVWLRPNRRALWLGALPALLLLFPAVYAIGWLQSPTARILGWGVVALAAAVVGAIAMASLQPRLAYARSQLLVYLNPGGPISVPIEVVECFFLGQGPSMLISAESRAASDQMITANVIVRLAESATEWRQVKVKRHLGQWCDGYITIRGAWCEPITSELVRALNKKLVAAHRACREDQEEQVNDRSVD